MNDMDVICRLTDIATKNHVLHKGAQLHQLTNMLQKSMLNSHLH